MSKQTKKPKKKSNSMKKAERVEWKDHFSQQGWSDSYDMNPVVVTSFGVPVRENKEVLVLAQNAVYETDTAGHGNNIIIVKKCIVSRKEIK